MNFFMLQPIKEMKALDGMQYTMMMANKGFYLIDLHTQHNSLSCFSIFLPTFSENFEPVNDINHPVDHSKVEIAFTGEQSYWQRN